MRPLSTAALSALVPLCLLFCGCRKEARPDGITLLIESPPDSLDDRLALSANGQRLAQLISPGLITFDDQSQPTPLLAESFQFVDDRTLEFKLRPGLTFHDGTTLDAADVKATYEGLFDAALKSPRADKYASIGSIETPDALTVRFNLKTAQAPILGEMTLGIVPAERARGDSARLQGNSPIGAGPFVFVSMKEEERVELLPFDHYFAGKPKMRALHVRVVRDETTRVLELIKGRADLVINAVSPPVLPALKENPKLTVLSKPGTGYAYLVLNVRSGPLSDVRVRRALCHALDVKPVVEAKFHGLAVPATNMLPATHWASAGTQLEGCPHDLARAKELLDEAGFPDPPGDAPRMTLVLKTSTDRFRKSVGLILRQQLSLAGIEVELRALEFGTFFGDVRKGNFEIAALKWASVIEPDLLRQVFSSTAVPTEANKWGGFNRGGYKNLQLDELLTEASAGTLAERREKYGEVLRVLDRELPYLPLWHESTVAVVSPYLKAFDPSAHGFFLPLAAAEEVIP